MPKEFSNSIEQVSEDYAQIAIMCQFYCMYATAAPVIHNCNGSTVCHVHVPIKRILCLDIVNHIDKRGERGTRALLTNSTSSEYGFAGNFLQAVA